jgi:hypothetical protein
MPGRDAGVKGKCGAVTLVVAARVHVFRNGHDSVMICYAGPAQVELNGSAWPRRRFVMLFAPECRDLVDHAVPIAI